MKTHPAVALGRSGLGKLADAKAPGERHTHDSVWLPRIAEFCADAACLGAVVLAVPFSIILLGLPIALLVRRILWALGVW